MTNKAYLAFGTNLGDKERNISEAYHRVGERIGEITDCSSLYYSKPWGFASDNDFVNSVACVKTALTPRQLLAATQQIEREMGRSTKSTGGEYHDRIIDIDIVLYEECTEDGFRSLHIDEPDLKIPHPLMQERDFVMMPLNEVLNADAESSNIVLCADKTRKIY